MNRMISKKVMLFLILPAIIFSFTVRPADKAVFTGSWKLNESKSDLGDFGGRFAARKIKADQKDDAITISKTTPGFNGGDDITNTETLTFDGKVSESTVFGNAKRKSTLKWTDDGKSFVVSNETNFERDGQSFEVKGTDTWTLSEDGKTLTSQIASSSAQGEFSMKCVYEKE